MEASAVPAGQLAGIVCMHGSALSHTAVMARALGIPAVVSLTPMPIGRLGGCEMVVDGNQGRIYLEPSGAVLDAFQRLIGEEQARSERLMALRDLPAETPDGGQLPLYVNIGQVSDTVAGFVCASRSVSMASLWSTVTTIPSMPKTWPWATNSCNGSRKPGEP